MIELPDPRSPPSRMDQLAAGVDCIRHPLIGNIVSHGNGTPQEQAENFLHSLRLANQVSHVTHETEAERQWRVAKIDAELCEWLARLKKWHKTNTVHMLSPLAGHPVNVSGPPPSAPAPPVLTAASQAELKTIEKLRAQKRDEEAATAALPGRKAKSQESKHA
jgi:hypothetical protein